MTDRREEGGVAHLDASRRRLTPHAARLTPHPTHSHSPLASAHRVPHASCVLHPSPDQVRLMAKEMAEAEGRAAGYFAITNTNAPKTELESNLHLANFPGMRPTQRRS